MTVGTVEDFVQIYFLPSVFELSVFDGNKVTVSVNGVWFMCNGDTAAVSS